MSTYQTDEINKDVLLSHDGQQVMMEWEKPYMEGAIDLLKPTGDVLEIGFGLGYSATRIMAHNPKSYTLVECDPEVIERVHKWMLDYPNMKITVVQGRWQEQLHHLGIFDQIFFDDFPLSVRKDSTSLEMNLSSKRSLLFIDACIRSHMRVGSRMSLYLNGNTMCSLSSDSKPFVEVWSKTIPIYIPGNCKYRNVDEQRCTVPIIVKSAEYDRIVARKWGLAEIRKQMKV